MIRGGGIGGLTSGRTLRKSGTLAGEISLEVGMSRSSSVGHDVMDESDGSSVVLMSVVASRWYSTSGPCRNASRSSTE